MDPKVKERLLRYTRGVAHRGLHDEMRPENSIPAFKAAIKAGFPFECDIHLTKDGQLVVCHDSSLERMCGKPGIIEELDYAKIRENYPLPGGSHIPTLAEVFELNGGKVPMVLELKAYSGNDDALAEAAIPLINALPNADQCLLISFSAVSLRAAKKAGCILPLGWLVGTEAVKHAEEKDLYEFDFLDVEVHYSLLPRFGRYRKKGGALLCWTVKNHLTYSIGKKRCHALTWEMLDSAKEKPKVNRFIQKTYLGK